MLHNSSPVRFGDTTPQELTPLDRLSSLTDVRIYHPRVGAVVRIALEGNRMQNVCRNS